MAFNDDIVILKDPVNYELPKWVSKDKDLVEPLPWNYNIGIVYKVEDGTVYETIGKKPRTVYFRVNSYIGMCMGAVHWYGYFDVYGPSVKIVKLGKEEKKHHKVGDTFSTNRIPEKCEGLKFDVSKVAKQDILSFSMLSGEREIRTKRGDHSTCFDSRKEVEDKIKREFKRIFKSGWKLEGKFGSQFEGEKDAETL